VCQDAGSPPVLEATNAVTLQNPAILQDWIREALRLHQAGQFAEADRLYRQILAIDPRHADALHLTGMIAFQTGRTEEAVAWIGKAIAIKPDAPSYHSNLGNVFQAQGRLAEAGASYQRALLLKPDLAEIHLNLGNILRELADLESALACFRRAQALKPALSEADVGESMVLLLQGDFASGWQKFERRWETTDYDTPMRVYPVPQWQGERLTAGRVLIWGEQGIGDEIMFAGLILDVLRSGNACVLDCSERLKPLFARSFPGAEVASGVDAGGLSALGIAAHRPSGGLPGLFRNTNAAFRSTQSPYLVACPATQDEFRRRYADGRKLVGIAWQTKNHKTGACRSIALSLLAPLFAIPGIRWVSLQYGDFDDLEHQAEAASAPILSDREVDQLADIDRFAAQVAAMDLVITIDNSTAHLAGALGVPTWVLLPFAPDWRWQTARTDCPWYPAMRLFRQAVRGDWSFVVRAIEDALTGFPAVENAAGTMQRE